MPPALPQRARRPLAGLLAAGVVGLSIVGVRTQLRRHAAAGQGEPSRSVCHPNLSRLANADGREVLLIGTLPLDLDGSCTELVRGALGSLRPEVVMVEGSHFAGVTAMYVSGQWELHGAPLRPGTGNWSDIGDAAPVEIREERPRSWRSLFGAPSSRLVMRSIVPLKVDRWAYHLHGTVGGDIAAAVTAAASSGVPMRFLGPPEGGFHGHQQVMLFARQALYELLEEERKRGKQMQGPEVDAALQRAEKHLRENFEKWRRNPRDQSAKAVDDLSKNLPPDVRNQVLEGMTKRVDETAARISSTMEGYHRAAVVIPVDVLFDVEERLLKAGYSLVSNCA